MCYIGWVGQPCLALFSAGGWGGAEEAEGELRGLRGMGWGGLEGLRIERGPLTSKKRRCSGWLDIFCLNPGHLDHKRSSIIISIWSQSSSRKGVFRVMKLSLRSYIFFLHETPSTGLFYHILYYNKSSLPTSFTFTSTNATMTHLQSVHLLAQNAHHSHMPFKITNKTP